MKHDDGMTTSRHTRGTAGGGWGAFSNADPMSILQQRHTASKANVKYENEVTTRSGARDTSGGGLGAVSNAYGDVPMSSLQQRHTSNTHHNDDNSHYQHDNHNNTEKEIQSSSSIKHERKKENHSETSFDVKQQKRKMQMGRRSLVRIMETRTQRNLGIKMWPYLSMGVGGFAQNARSWNTLEQ